MKKPFAVLVFLLLFSRVFALQLELSGGLGNIAFDTDRTSALSGSPPGVFDRQLFPLALARLSGDEEGFAWNAGFEYDPVTRSNLSGNVKLDMGYFSLEAGAFFSLFNSLKLPANPGVSATLDFELPGIVFFRAGGNSTFAFIDMEKKGNHRQYGTRLAAGFWVPFVVCSLNMDYKSFALRKEAALLIEDELTRYYFSADVYTKNIPYTIRVDLGYQSLGRSYGDTGLKDEFNSIFIGFEGIYTLSPALKFLLAGEMPVYSWGSRPMEDPPAGSVIFKASTGIILTLGG